jgi:hypothetical protein
MDVLGSDRIYTASVRPVAQLTVQVVRSPDLFGIGTAHRYRGAHARPAPHR